MIHSSSAFSHDFCSQDIPVVVTCATDVAVLFGDKASDSPCRLGTVWVAAAASGFTGFWQAPIYLFEWFSWRFWDFHFYCGDFNKQKQGRLELLSHIKVIRRYIPNMRSITLIAIRTWMSVMSVIYSLVWIRMKFSRVFCKLWNASWSCSQLSSSLLRCVQVKGNLTLHL